MASVCRHQAIDDYRRAEVLASSCGVNTIARKPKDKSTKSLGAGLALLLAFVVGAYAGMWVLYLFQKSGV